MRFLQDFTHSNPRRPQKIEDESSELGILKNAASSLVRAGAEIILICSNTTNRCARTLQKKVRVPIIHVVDATANCLRKHNCTCAGLVGTELVMGSKFYGEIMKEHEVELLIPGLADRKIVDRIIYDELCNNIISVRSKLELARIVRDLKERGAQAVILGCTELPLLLSQDEAGVCLIDSIQAHIDVAIESALLLDEIAAA